MKGKRERRQEENRAFVSKVMIFRAGISKSETRGRKEEDKASPKGERLCTVQDREYLFFFFFLYTKIAEGNPKTIRTLNNGDVGDSRCNVRSRDKTTKRR